MMCNACIDTYNDQILHTHVTCMLSGAGDSLLPAVLPRGHDELRAPSRHLPRSDGGRRAPNAGSARGTSRQALPASQSFLHTKLIRRCVTGRAVLHHCEAERHST